MSATATPAPTTTGYTNSPATSTHVSPSTNSSGGSSGVAGSPLLFFVALGFGILFTNLWIIVGVKYCFRYNQRQRARQLALQYPDGVPPNVTIGRDGRPAHGHGRRRRREKKLMSIEEAEERFPTTTYKAWRMRREMQGLSVEGGVSKSRPGSVHEMILDTDNKNEEHGEEVQEVVGKDVDVGGKGEASGAPRTSMVHVRALSSASTVTYHADDHQKDTTITTAPDTDTDTDLSLPTIIIEEPLTPTLPHSHAQSDNDNDHDHDSGDNCAICIDTLEDTDIIRALPCGHAYHATCLDPWLTTRKASCPLCKRDYYVPKVVPGQEAGPGVLIGEGRSGVVQAPQPVHVRFGGLMMPLWNPRGPSTVHGAGGTHPSRPTPAETRTSMSLGRGSQDQGHERLDTRTGRFRFAIHRWWRGETPSERRRRLGDLEMQNRTQMPEGLRVGYTGR
ncbi:hypothetical protein SAICODRAFT_21064 [Saitoella complicata NRRL Y-17804]|uniref:uncharacterized protein n=1 Tax=Saitoella complicata (strain BCRC 22490 / CBS 7301 / JCM 7358 / NBRC 10748 / NRRL Y-17804) TaxID=698492 RepID=UPI000866D193|nr:uncharacterized protein SAICODRAFT_21064 [Saitoella complicata NRRL Y-17804]ODQ51031.1 hypothetical protein SAICODRAFT_21064 [Saitoella complicata NRRL Y-17804]